MPMTLCQPAWLSVLNFISETLVLGAGWINFQQNLDAQDFPESAGKLIAGHEC